MGQIAQAINQIESVMQQTAARATESAVASEAISAQANELTNVVTVLLRIAGQATEPDRRAIIPAS